MSRLDAFFKGWSFRTNKPTFEVGRELAAFVTGYDTEEDTALVRIGDTVLRIPDGSPDIVDTRVRLRVEEFDDADHTGRAIVLERIGETMY